MSRATGRSREHARDGDVRARSASRAPEMIAALSLLVCSCGGGSLTEIVAIADSDLGPAAIDTVRFVVRRPGGEEQTSTAPWAPGEPAYVGIVHDGGPLGPIEVRAEGMRGATVVLERRARVSFVEGRTMVLRLDLFARCVGASCTGEQTCAENGCRGVDVSPSELEEWTGVPGGIDAGVALDGGLDAGADGGTDGGTMRDGGCVASAESCNGEDDDCDGYVDEDFGLESDASNCGACGHVCSSTCVDRACPEDPVAIAIGGMHACAVDASGATYCWGENGDGQLGDGSTTPSSTPVAVAGPLAALELAAGARHTCARTAAGVSCWGAGDRSQLSGTGGSDTPRSVPIGPATSICAGDEHACAVVSGVLFCWGANDAGQTGDALATTTSTPGALLLTNVAEVACGARHTCAIADPTRSVYCFGDNTFSQLGRTGSGGVTPMRVSTISDVAHVTAGRDHTCVLLADGRVQCFGDNDDGQLGNGSTAEGATPRDVAGLTDAIAVAAASASTCAVRVNGTVVCWGRRSAGAIGDGITGLAARSPAAVLELADAARVYAGGDAACARRAGARVSCWGTMSGGLGDGATTMSASPVDITLP